MVLRRLIGMGLRPALLLAGLVLAACSNGSENARPTVPANYENVEVSRVYRLGVGDKVKITVFGEQDLSGQFEIGALGTLSGNNGVINASGDVIVGGTIDPGNSPGRIRINCNLISLPGSVLRLEIQSDGAGGFITDQLVIGDDSTFDFSNFRVVFSFLDDTDVNAFAASGGFDFDNFLRTGVGTDESQGLSAAFGAGVTWANQINSSLVTVESMAYNVSGLTFGGDGGVTVTASRIPEPATWLMVLMGLATMSTLAKRRRVAGALVH